MIRFRRHNYEHAVKTGVVVGGARRASTQKFVREAKGPKYYVVCAENMSICPAPLGNNIFRLVIRM